MKKKRDELLIRALFGRGDVFTLMGKYGASILDFEKISEISADNRKKVKASIALGNIHLTKGDTKRSYKIFSAALRAAKKHMLAIEEGTILNCLSNLKIVETETTKARKFAEKAFEVYRSIRRKNNERTKGIAESFNNLGGIYSAEGKLRLALEYYMRSLKARESIEDKVGKAIILNNIGVTLMDMREYRKAMEFLKKSMVLRKSMGFIQGIALCASNIGIVCWKQRRYNEAIGYFQENIKIQRALGDKKGLSTSLSNLGVANKARGAYEDAIRCHEESLEVRKKVGDRFGMTINLNQLGWIYLMRGNYKKVLSVTQKEKEICNEIENLPRLMNYYNLQGNILASRRKYKEGYECIKRSLEISKKLHLEIDEACDLYSMGDILLQAIEGGETTTGMLKEARKLLEKGAKILKKHDNETVKVQFLKGFSRIDLLEGRFCQAEEKINKAERIVLENNFKEKMPSILFLKAGGLLGMGRIKEGRNAAVKAEKIAQELRMKPILLKLERLKQQYQINA